MSPPEPERQLVEFSLHGERYALPIGGVREILRYTPPAATATATGAVQGMIARRGRVLPVVDLGAMLGRRTEVTRSTRILVVEVAGGELGLVVDAVEGVITVPAEQIGPVPVPVAHEGLGEEVATLDGRIIMLIEPERALGGVLAPRRSPRRRTGGGGAPRARRSKPT